MLYESLQSASSAAWDSAGWFGVAIGTVLSALGITGLVAIPKRYMLRTLDSKSNTADKKRWIQEIAKSSRTKQVHIAGDNAVIDLSGTWLRQYRIRIYFDSEQYFIHSTLVHYKFVSPLHLGYSSRQTERVMRALRTVDQSA